MASVAIRGYGIVSAYGEGVAALRAGLAAGAPALAPLPALAPPADRQALVSAVNHAHFPLHPDGTGAMARLAIEEALAMAGIGAEELRDCALVVGGSAMLAHAEQASRELYRTEPGRRPRLEQPGTLTHELAKQFDLRGPTLTLSTACASSANAILVARDLVARRRAARALVVGIERLCATTLSGFSSLMLLDPNGCRPFDVNRRGLHFGEGVGALLLERDHAGEPRLARLAGGASLCDVHHPTRADPDGSGMARCMRQALHDAVVPAEAIVAVKAHGTGSSDSDAAEAAAMRSVFATMPPFTALKGYFGHTLAACGATETIAFLASIKEGSIPPTAGFETVDPEIGLSPLRQPLPVQAGNYLLNYFGFGGNCASLVIAHG
jgi:3-oxoacyl-(acyl-carrier-protein) synthase